jgi:hypothetical protein
VGREVIFPQNASDQRIVRCIAWFCERRKGDMDNNWQPIETAPKDGTDILVGWWSAGVWIVRNAWWEDGFDIELGAIDPAGEGWWYPNTSVGTYKVCRENNAVDGPQYWMPMPEPPAEHGSK